MKQLLFLLLFPAYAMAQYPGNAGQKITLGEQTTADGLVWRGKLADTANLLTNKLDTSVYIVLDTGTRAMWYYRASTTPKWTRLVDSLNNLQGQLSLTTKVTGVLPVTNGGTGADMSSLPNNYLVRTNSSGVFDTSAVYEADGKVGIGLIPDFKLHIASPIGSDFLQYTEDVTFKTSRFGVQVTSNYGKLLFNSYNIPMYLSSGKAGGTGGIVAIQTHDTLGREVERMRVDASGNVGIGTTTPAVQFHTTSNVRFAGLASITDLRTDADGDLFNGSDFNLKNSIDTINFGLSDVLKLKPVSFNWNDEQRNINEYKSMGFIAQDVMDVIPNAASTMGDGDMQVDYNAIVATLTKAIQEQQALIKALEQRILNLENK